MSTIAGKTILQVTPELDAGGAERTTLEVAKAIVEAGGRALVASRGGRLAADIEAAGGVVLRLPAHSKNPFVMRANARRLADIIRKETVDIIHARSRAPAWSALWAARATRTPFVTTYHGAYKSGGPLKRFYNSSMTRADRVIANSEFTATAIRAGGGIEEGRLVVIPRGADLVRFDPRSVDSARRDAIRASWGLGAGDSGPAILLPARLTDWKGHLVAVAAFAEIAETIDPGACLILAGDDQGRTGYRAQIEAAIAVAGLQARIRLVGHEDDMPGALAAADLVLSPATRPEAFGRVAAEAGAMEKIVIAANHGGARETVIDGETGFLSTPGDASALAGAIKQALALSSDQRAAMAEAARARIAAHYSISSMTAATLAVYADFTMNHRHVT